MNFNTENKDEWLTPPHIIETCGNFDLDPCSPLAYKRPFETANNYYTIHDDGLNAEWEGRVWCNPPYGKETFKWLNKLAEHNNGIALIFARTETKGFHAEIWEKADAIFFIKGRLAFYKVDGTVGNTSNAPSCLIAYGSNNVETLKNIKIEGKFIELNNSHG